MGRRMYSESQLNKMIDSKLKGYDARIPTDLAADDQPTASLIHLTHNTNVIGDSVYLKKIFGNSIIGEGNIHLYNHYIRIDGSNGKVCCFTVVSPNYQVASGANGLNTLLGSTAKAISCSGYLTKADGTGVGIFLLDWKGSVATSKLYLLDGTNINLSDSGLSSFKDVVESV